MVVGVLDVMELGSQCSDSDVDSDSELQRAFESGKLQPGLYQELPAPVQKQHVNDKVGLQQKLDEFRLQLDWIEKLDLVCEPAKAIPGETDIEDSENTANDDFKRELLFYRQAQTAVLEGIPRLKKLGVPTKRPEDYFAQMVKSDDHMRKVREKILAKKVSAELSEKAKKLREMRKFGKRVQQDVLMKRQKEKKDMLESVKKYRKGQQDQMNFLDEKKDMPQSKSGGKQQPGNKKRDWKNKKFGFGGQKKRLKRNTKSSASDTREFDPVKYTFAPNKVKKIKKQGNKSQRPGKSRRQKTKSLKHN